MKKTLMVFAFERSFFSEEQETQNQKAAYRTSAFLPFQPQMAVCLVSSLSHSENHVCLVEKKAPPHSAKQGWRRLSPLPPPVLLVLVPLWDQIPWVFLL